jgi:hypothetical protein
MHQQSLGLALHLRPLLTVERRAMSDPDPPMQIELPSNQKHPPTERHRMGWVLHRERAPLLELHEVLLPTVCIKRQSLMQGNSADKNSDAHLPFTF